VKLLLITPLLHGGGAERCARDLFERLPAHGVQPTAFLAARRGEDPPTVRGLRLPGEKYLRALEWVAGPLDWRHLGSRRALDAVGSGDYDLVHAHNLHGGWLCLRALQRLGQRIPLVWTLHDEWAITGGLGADVSRVARPQELDRLFGRRYALHACHPAAVAARSFLEPLFPEPALLICPSRHLTELARAHPRFRSIPVHRIPYGVSILEREESRVSRIVARRAFGLRDDEKVILLGAADLTGIYKGASLAVDALGHLGATEARLLVLGRNPEAITARVRLPAIAPGFISDNGTLAMAFRAADVTLIPSIADNFPNVGLESMACETPLAAFGVGGLVEMIGQSERGLLAPPFDAAELARNLRRLLEDRDLARRLGAAGRRWTEANCSMGSFLSAHLSAYAEVRATRRVLARPAHSDHLLASRGA
jgi:glycosyltransferase involved in cell wall biosynthesis